MILSVSDHFLENLNLFLKLLFCHFRHCVLGLELLLVVDRDCSAGTELVLGDGAGAQWNNVQEVEVHLVILSCHLPVELGDYHSIEFFQVFACCYDCQFIVGLLSDTVE